MRLLDTLRYTWGINSSCSENYNIRQSLIPGLPDIANLNVPGLFCKIDRGHCIHLHNTSIVSTKSRECTTLHEPHHQEAISVELHPLLLP
jgi:hypothetical protein